MLSLFSIVLRKWSEYATFRKTQYELNGLTNRDLRDLGIARCDIEFIARKHAREFYNASPAK
jgi:uncharacterized protein YjiS (DUF1127 family)